MVVGKSIVYMPIWHMKVDDSESGGETDPLSWLLTYAGYGNYKIDTVNPIDTYPGYEGWNVSFKDESIALAFKLRWV